MLRLDDLGGRRCPGRRHAVRVESARARTSAALNGSVGRSDLHCLRQHGVDGSAVIGRFEPFPTHDWARLPRPCGSTALATLLPRDTEISLEPAVSQLAAPAVRVPPLMRELDPRARPGEDRRRVGRRAGALAIPSRLLLRAHPRWRSFRAVLTTARRRLERLRGRPCRTSDFWRRCSTPRSRRGSPSSAPRARTRCSSATAGAARCPAARPAGTSSNTTSCSAPLGAATSPPISRRSARGTTCAACTRACCAAPARHRTGCASSWGAAVGRSALAVYRPADIREEAVA
jgi:hypothetical protein